MTDGTASTEESGKPSREEILRRLLEMADEYRRLPTWRKHMLGPVVEERTDDPHHDHPPKQVTS